MSEEAREWTTVGVVGDDGDVSDALSPAVRTVRGDVSAVLDAEPSVVVAVGEPALLSLARRRPDVPVLPVGAGRGVRSVPRSAVGDVTERLARADWHVDEHPLVAVNRPESDPVLALFDAMLVTAEPADISEYSVATGGERVARFRADGVVIATPAGSSGYAGTAGGPVVPPESDVLVVVPIAPFATTLDHWVVPLGPVRITVERDEAPVEVLADDRSVGTAAADSPVSLEPAGHVGVVRLPESGSPFDRRGTDLEKL